MNILLPTIMSLRNMIAEMNRKHLDLKRISKTASLLLLSGLSRNSIPPAIIQRCLKEQQQDGGWVSIADTAWNAYFLKLLDPLQYKENIEKALHYIISRQNDTGLWGRSKRDVSRIPVTAVLFFLFPEMADSETLHRLEKLWLSEKNSLTYKAGYTLMAFKAAGFQPLDKFLTADAARWLMDNRQEDGGFAPWKDHPVSSDVFCTSIATLGLLQYKEAVPEAVFRQAYHWLVENRLPGGIWPYHEIEDGASWGLYALTQLTGAGLDE
ncbi:MAG: terpene cyclase/mutase family protein [Candidatus Aminicenantes bacterium]|nr:terpene cyclase/mutase family protein [Candidatus Aminicenantes bacterium]